MSKTAAEIARKIDQLEHPDAVLQDSILAELSAQAERALPVVLANFPLVSARVRRALLRWLINHPSSEISLPLMRYIFDERENMAEDMGRVMAMGLLFRRAEMTENPSERGRLRAFSEDISRDSNPEIRTLAVRILAHIGDARSIEAVEPLRADKDEQVREAAYQALAILEDAIPTGEESTQSKEELLQQLLNSYGPRQRQWVRHWHRHNERASIALSILRNRGDLRGQALQILLKEPRKQARPFLAPMILENPSSDLAILSLRLLVELVPPGESRPDEVEAIRRALRSTSLLSRAAACAAIEALELPNFLDEVASYLLSPDLELATAAARAVAALATREHQHLINPLCQAIDLHERRRREELSQVGRAELVTSLLTAMQAILSPRSLYIDEVQRLTLRTLERSGHHRPIRAAGVALLLELTPPAGLDESKRWDEAPCRLLLSLLEPQDLASARPMAELLKRVAPSQLPGLASAAKELWESGAVDVIALIIPLLERAETEEAFKILKEISHGDDPKAAQAARDALRRYRNKGDVIDAEFIPRKK